MAELSDPNNQLNGYRIASNYLELEQYTHQDTLLKRAILELSDNDKEASPIKDIKLIIKGNNNE